MLSKTMKAAVYRRYGPPEVVQIATVKTPVPKKNEMLVRVRATSVCAADWRARSGDPFLVRFIAGLLRPKIRVLGMEFAGTIVEVGKDVRQFGVGERVFGLTGFKFGCHAQYVCVPQDGRIATTPANIPDEDAAGVCFGALTALTFLRKGELKSGQNVLVYGASGSVGTFAVQLAKHFGARVTGVSSTANLDLVRSLGADDVVDYTQADFSKAGHVYDMVFDAVGKSGFWRMRALKRGGHYVLVAAPIVASWLWRLWTRMTGAARIVGGITRGENGDLELIRDLMGQGAIRTIIDRRYSLDDIREAHRYVQCGHKKGNVIVIVD